MKIALTGGHITPALALIETLKKSEKSIDFVFFGRVQPIEGDKSVSFEYSEILRLGIKFIEIKTGRLQRKFTRLTIPSLLKIPLGFGQALYHLKKEKPNLTVAFGGYLSVPVVIAAKLLNIPVIIHEQTVSFGLGNKINSLFADKILLANSSSQKYFPKSKSVIIGNPIRLSVFKRNTSNLKLLSFFKKIAKRKLIYVTGGSLGSHFLNQQILKIAPKLVSNYALIVQTGESSIFNDYREFIDLKAKLPTQKSNLIYVVKFVDNSDIGAVLNRADLIISRSGANTVSEVAALSKVAIFIPLPFASKKEQAENAKLLSRIGAAKIIPQSQVSNQILTTSINQIFQNFSQHHKAALKAKQIIASDANYKFAQIIFSYLQK